MQKIKAIWKRVVEFLKSLSRKEYVMAKEVETKMCLVDEAENVIFELEPYRYGYVIPKEYQDGSFILNEGDVYKVISVLFEN